MKFRLILDPSGEEEVVATVHSLSPFTERLEALVREKESAVLLTGYHEDTGTIRFFQPEEVECILVLDSKTCAVDWEGHLWVLKHRLYELEALLPACFIRINKSALANSQRLERFTATFCGGVDAIFRSGFREYVSRRCFAAIKKGLDKK